MDALGLRLRLSVMLGVILEPSLAQRLEKFLELSLLVVVQRGQNGVLVAAVLQRLFALVLGNLPQGESRLTRGCLLLDFLDSFLLHGKYEKSPASISAYRALRGRNRTRTCDPIDVNDVLYQLSHATKSLCQRLV